MATKRPAPHVHPSRQDQVPDEPRRKRQKPNNAGPKSFKKAHPVNELKSEIRSLKRLLERDEKLPATVRVEKERALRTAQDELERTQQAKRRSDMIGRYHKIRFFDRQKAAKRLKQAQKQLDAFDGDKKQRKKLAKVVEDAEVDVNYAQFFPLDKPYVSLFPRKREEDGDEASKDSSAPRDGSAERKGDPEMWRKVKECMVDGTLDDLRNGRLHEESALEKVQDVDFAVHEETTTKDVKQRKDKAGALAVKKRSQPNVESEGSDGGFFE